MVLARMLILKVSRRSPQRVSVVLNSPFDLSGKEFHGTCSRNSIRNLPELINIFTFFLES